MSKINVLPITVTISCIDNILYVEPEEIFVNSKSIIKWKCEGDKTFDINLDGTPLSARHPQVNKNKPAILDVSKIKNYKPGSYHYSVTSPGCKQNPSFEEPVMVFDN